MPNRVSLIICGQPRTFEFCFPSLKKHIIDVYQPDIFISTDDHKERITELYKPMKINVTDQELIFDLALEKRKYLSSVLAVNDLCIAWKINEAMQMKMKHEKDNHFVYDTVILTRFDVKFTNVPNIKAKYNTFHAPLTGGYWNTPPAEPGIHWGGYSAHLCWASSEIMNGLSYMYFDEKDYLTLANETNVPYGWAPEHVLKNYLDVNNISVHFENISMMLIRGTNKNPLAFDNSRLDKYPEYL